MVNTIPTSKNIVVFNSYPDYTDNSQAIFKYLHENRAHKYRYIWLVNEKEDVKNIKERITKDGYIADVFYKKSLKGLWAFIRCRYCFHTHGILGSISLHQHEDKMINLWHGMPLKNIGITDGEPRGFMKNTDYLLATSNRFQDVMSECFDIPEDRVLPIGLPRCDLLFEPTDFFTQRNIDVESYDKIGIWLPTYRYSIVETEKRIDGTYIPGAISFLEEKDLEKLNGDLARLNHLMIIKLHPMDKSQLYEFKTYSNILIVKQKDMKSQLYPLLGRTDYLLTDFSSVCIDYDILKKPMGFTIPDFDSYSNSRGFVFNDVLSILPGPIITNYEELVQFIKALYYKPSTLEFNKYRDNKACERLVNFLKM